MKRQRLGDLASDVAAHWDTLCIQEMLVGNFGKNYDYMEDNDGVFHRVFHKFNTDDNMARCSAGLKKAVRTLHQIDELAGGAKASGIVINNRWEASLLPETFASTKLVVVTISINEVPTKLVTMHLPDASDENETAEQILQILQHWMEERPGEHWMIGSDTNGIIGELEDEEIMRLQTMARSQYVWDRSTCITGTRDNRDPRGALLVGWLTACGLSTVSVLTGEFTHSHYVNHAQSTRDFIFVRPARGTSGISFGIEDVKTIKEFVEHGEDHVPNMASFAHIDIQRCRKDRGHIAERHRRRGQIGWKPKDVGAYQEEVECALQQGREQGQLTIKDLTEIVAHAARSQQLPKLQTQIKHTILNQVKACEKLRLCTFDPEQRRELSKQIWKHRKQWKRVRAQIELTQIYESKGLGKYSKQSLSKQRIQTNYLFDTSKPPIKVPRCEWNMVFQQHFEKMATSTKWKAEHFDLEAKWEYLCSQQYENAVPITTLETQEAMYELNMGKSGANDGLVLEMVLQAGEGFHYEMACRYTAKLQNTADENDQQAWADMEASLMAKVAKPSLATQFRALHSTPTLAQIFDKIIQRRIEPKLQIRLGPEIIGFRKNHQVHELTLYLKSLIECQREYGKPLFVLEADIKKAFDESEHGEISNSLSQQGAPEPEVCALHRERVRKNTIYKLNGVPVTERIFNFRGAPQGMTTSPLCFRSLLNTCLEESGEKLNVVPPPLHNFQQGKLVWADNIIFMDSCPARLQTRINNVNAALTNHCLQVEWDSKAQWAQNEFRCLCSECAVRHENQGFEIEGNGMATQIRHAENNRFQLLGNIIDLQGGDHHDIMHRQAQYWKAYYARSKLLNHKGVPAHERVRITQLCLLPVLLWGSVNWSDRQSTFDQILKSHREVLARVAPVPRLAHESYRSWYRRRWPVWNKLLRKVQCAWAPVKWISQKYSWLGHVARLSNPEQVTEGTPVGVPRIVREVRPYLTTACATERGILQNRSGGRRRAGAVAPKVDGWIANFHKQCQSGDPEWQLSACNRNQWASKRNTYVIWKLQRLSKHSKVLTSNATAVLKGKFEHRLPRPTRQG